MNTAAQKLTEFRVHTACGRNFVWSAPDEDSLKISLKDGSYRATMIMENSEYERMLEDEQRKLNHELDGAA